MYQLGDYVVDTDRNIVAGPGGEHALLPRTMAVLDYLLTRPGQLVTAEQLLTEVWRGTNVNAVQKAISEIRQAFTDDPKHPRIIKTHPRRGYSIIHPVEALTDADTEPAIAFLALNDRSLNADQAHLSLGLPEQLAGAFAGSRGLNIISTSSSFAFAQAALAAPEIGRELGANYVITGSILGDTGSIRVSLGLVSVENGFELWAESFDSNEAEVISLIDDVLRAITVALRQVLYRADSSFMLLNAGTQNARALNLYMMASSSFQGVSRKAVPEIVNTLDAAIAEDPTFVDAYVLKADALTCNAAKTAGIDEETGFRMALAAIREARQHDVTGRHNWEHLEATYTGQGIIVLQPERIEQHLRNEIVGGFDDALPAYGMTLINAGLWHTALRYLQMRPASRQAVFGIAIVMLKTSDADAAVRFAEEKVRERPGDELLAAVRTQILARAGRPDEAWEHYSQQPADLFQLGGDGKVHHRLARAIWFGEPLSDDDVAHVQAAELFATYRALELISAGRVDEGLAMLRSELQLRRNIDNLSGLPLFEPLLWSDELTARMADHPSYQEVKAQLGLTAAWQKEQIQRAVGLSHVTGIAVDPRDPI